MKQAFVIFIILSCFAFRAFAENAVSNSREETLISGLQHARTPDERARSLGGLSGYYLSAGSAGKAVNAYRSTINDANIGAKEKYSYYMAIGDIYLDSHQYSSSIEFYQEAVSVLPRLEPARLKLANVCEQSDLNELAKQAYIDDLKFNKKSFDAEFGLASLYMKQGLNTQAMEHFRRALAVRQDTELCRRSAFCAELSGDVSIALVMLRQIPSEQRTFDDLISLGRLYSEINKFKEAEESFSIAIKMDTERTEGYIYLALLYLDNKDFPPAEKLLQIALGKAPNEATVHFFLGCLYSGQGKTQLACKEMKKAEDLARTDVLKTYSRKFISFTSMPSK